jgi:hypothetical protein
LTSFTIWIPFISFLLLIFSECKLQFYVK